jgi:inosine-uridine nucleoside N-ribohydrolase
MLEFYFEFQRKKNGFFGGYMHDPTAVVAMVRPELFRFRRAEVRVDTTRRKTRGRTMVEFSNDSDRANTKVAISVDEDSAREVIMSALTNYE